MTAVAVVLAVLVAQLLLGCVIGRWIAEVRR